jgi:hypothetical protein
MRQRILRAAPAGAATAFSVVSVFVLAAVFACSVAVGTAHAGMGGYPDLAVRGITVTPARAHVGDTVNIKVLLRNLGYAGDQMDIFPRILANGKKVASEVFSFGGDPQDTYTTTFQWNTSGAAPGQYSIQADFSYDSDPTPDDNQLTLKTPVVLAAPGAPFPDGQPAGGTVKYTDPAEKEWWDR